MHIVMLHDTLPAEQPDDAAAAVWRLGQGLIAAGQRVTFITTTPGTAQVEQRGGITVHALHSRYATRWAAWYGLLNPQTVVPLQRTLRALKPDIVHAHDVQIHLGYHSLVLGRRSGAATVFTSRNALPFAYRTPELRADRCEDIDYRLPLLANWQHARLRWNPTHNLSLRHTMRYYTDAKIAVSETHRQALAANRLPSFEVIHDGIKPESVPPEAGLAALRQRLRLGQRALILFAAGAPGSDGETQILAALRRVHHTVPDAALWVFGADEPRAARLRRENPDLGDSLLMPQRDLVGVTRAAACALADVLALPRTIFEPWPLAVLEAQAAGTPAVVSCYGGAREAVIDGATGIVVHPRDVDALAGAIVRLLSDADLRSRRGEAGRRRVASSFPLAQQVTATLDLYERARARREGAAA